MNTDLRKLLRGYSNKWVALSSDSRRVAGVADTVGEAIKQAHEKGEQRPILTRVPENYSMFI